MEQGGKRFTRGETRWNRGGTTQRPIQSELTASYLFAYLNRLVWWGGTGWNKVGKGLPGVEQGGAEVEQGGTGVKQGGTDSQLPIRIPN